MSISNRHTVNLFVAGKSAPMSDQRLAKVGYKSTAKNPAKFPSICVSVPMFAEFEPEQIDRLGPYIIQMLENAQDGVIRSLYESRDGNLTEVSDDDICLDACISYLEAESTGGRLTKEYLEQWFDASVRDNLFVCIAEKLGFDEITPDVEVTVNKHVAGYKAMIASLSGGKTFYQEPQIKGLLRALEVSSVDDDTSKKLNVRLKGMLNRPKIEDLLGL